MKNINRKYDRKKRGILTGFTLVEILISMVVGTILLIGLYGIYVVSSQSYRRSTNQEELTQNARVALERISRDLRQTSQIVTTLPLTKTDVLNPPPSTIQFQDGHYTAKIRYITYSVSGANLVREVSHYSFSASPTTWVAWNILDQYGNLPTKTVDETTIKADKIGSLAFYGDNTVNIDLTTTGNDLSFTFSTTVNGRNI